MKRLIIQIPCLNEEETLPVTLRHLPRSVPGIDRVEWLIIDDGSSDGTVEVARAHGVDHIVRHRRNMGLARAFMTGLEASLRLGADVIVNTDADNQYSAEDIPRLVQPILDGKYEMVVGVRSIRSIEHFSPIKKLLQKLGSWVVRLASKTDIGDTTSGFRGMSREAAQRLHVFSSYTYTLETIIQAGQKQMAIGAVPIRTNARLRSSRLVSSVPQYLGQSVVTIVRIFMTYRPFVFFTAPALILMGLGSLIFLRFLYFFSVGEGQGHIQSLILGALLVGAAVVLAISGLIADLISVNRKLLESIDWQLKRASDEITSDKASSRQEKVRRGDG